ncbi:dynamin family protein [Streptomyces sp. PSKA30]|uniref:dynamin family protein n=1 Tax=Streptomyces sp. PSKA30 TaxID=2874597 RepID=UPI001CD0987C|nr:dynamin family protein [Streptomyces sp. PSKA30]MBZ9641809.1 dynamin family protein [Streptomyces sp. PSKA30]
MEQGSSQDRAGTLGDFDDWGSRIGTLKDLYQRIRMVADEAAGLMEEDPRERRTIRLDSTGSVFDRETFRVLVLGEFSSGKSTLINAMLGKPLLPMKANPTTAFTTLLRWGETEQAELYRAMDRRGQATVVSTEKFQEEVALQFDARGATREPSFSLAVVSQPLELLRRSVEIVDTAGINEDAAREQVTLSFLEEVDAVMYVTDALRPFTLTETQNYLEQVYALGHRDVFYVVNRIDLIDEDERDDVMRRCRNEVAELEGSLNKQMHSEVHFVSARNALRARIAGDTAAVERSGIMALQSALEVFCLRDAARVKFVRLAEYLRQTAIRLRKHFQNQSGGLARTTQELREALDSSQTSREQLQQDVGRIRRIVESWVSDVEKDIQAKFADFLAEISETVPGWNVKGPGLLDRAGRVITSSGRDSVANRITDQYTSLLQRHMQVFCSVTLEEVVKEHQTQLLDRLTPLIREYETALEEMRGQLTGANEERQSDQLLYSLALSASRGGFGDIGFQDLPFRFRPGEVTALAAGIGAAGAGGLALAGTSGLIGLGFAVPPLGVALAVGAALGPVLGAVSLAVSSGKLRARVGHHIAEQLRESAGAIAKQYARSRGAELRDFWNGVADSLSERLREVIADIERSIDQSRLDEQEKQAKRDELYRYEQALTSVEAAIGEFLRPYVSEAARE